jgi:hypothetical protein
MGPAGITLTILAIIVLFIFASRLADYEKAKPRPNINLDQPSKGLLMENEKLPSVRIVDVDMPFLSMVGFMLKWTLATIPAILILIGLWALLMGVFGGISGTV